MTNPFIPYLNRHTTASPDYTGQAFRPVWTARKGCPT